MPFSLKLPARLLLALFLLSVSACSTTPSTALPPQAPLVVKEAEILPLSPELKKKPLPSGGYLKRAAQREETMLESLKTSPAK
jgi:hypothetical protein